MRDETLPKAKVAFVPGAAVLPVAQEANHARVNFSGCVGGADRGRGESRLAGLLRATLGT